MNGREEGEKSGGLGTGSRKLCTAPSARKKPLISHMLDPPFGFAMYVGPAERRKFQPPVTREVKPWREVYHSKVGEKKEV